MMVFFVKVGKKQLRRRGTESVMSEWVVRQPMGSEEESKAG